MAALAVGLIALMTIAREEEPQISVPMVDIRVNADGLKAPDAVELVTKPLEAIIKGIDGVEHVYSQTVDDRVMVTARFLVGTKSDEAILRVHEKIRANLDRIPVGIPEPLIVGRGINDVAVVVLTLSPKPDAAARWTDKDLYELADQLRSELVKTDNVGLTYISGGNAEQIRVEPDPEKLALFGVTLQQLVAKVRDANRSFQAGSVRDNGTMRDIAAGQTLAGIPDIGLLLVTTRDNRPVYVRDVASVVIGPSPQEHRVWMGTPGKGGHWDRVPAVSVAFAKRAGANAVVVAEQLLARLQSVEGRLVPADVNVTVTRDYGETANDKANELLFHLGLATVSIVVLIAFAIGWREALVTLVVIPTTILLTLFASKIMGYTINRVSLFALIFSIGILVDDAIVVIENIARHWAMKDGRTRMRAAIEAVAEVGNPTVVATLDRGGGATADAVRLGVDGPLYGADPGQCVGGDGVLVHRGHGDRALADAAPASGRKTGARARGCSWRGLSRPALSPLRHAGGALAPLGLDIPERGRGGDRAGLPLVRDAQRHGQAAAVRQQVGNVGGDRSARRRDAGRHRAHVVLDRRDVARQLPEIRSIETYAGTPAPFNFNGLVRHYYVRELPELGELHLNLAPRDDRKRSSHEIALDLRARLKNVTLPAGTVARVVEVPPGPPVLATLLAEVYGPSSTDRRAVAHELKKIFASVPYIVDIDDSIGQPRPRLRISIDQDRLEYFGVEQRDVYDTIAALFGGTAVGYSHRGEGRNPIEIVVRLPKRDLSWSELLASTPVPANSVPGNKTVVELGDVVRIAKEVGSPTIFRRDGRFADMVMAELAGAYEAPIYGILDVDKKIEAHDWGVLGKPMIRFHGQPDDESKPAILWDGEWEITYVTFRDMGAAFMVAIVGIYILVVAQFGSFKLPLVVLTPIPLTLIGIVIGHWLFGAPFTATSMIGFIALAGIIVRNSILLVDFIRHGAGQGKTLREVLLEAGAVRFKPILLTALAAMIGAATILVDPIFQGLAISLLFGLASSTLLTVLVIPAIYVVLRDADAVIR